MDFLRLHRCEGKLVFILPRMSEGPLFSADRTGRLVFAIRKGSRVRASDRGRLEKPSRPYRFQLTQCASWGVGSGS